jgi:hypothetical protein
VDAHPAHAGHVDAGDALLVGEQPEAGLLGVGDVVERRGGGAPVNSAAAATNDRMMRVFMVRLP